MAWRRPGDKLLSEPMMVSLLTHICVTRPQWVKGSFDFTSATLQKDYSNKKNYGRSRFQLRTRFQLKKYFARNNCYEEILLRGNLLMALPHPPFKDEKDRVYDTLSSISTKTSKIRFIFVISKYWFRQLVGTEYPTTVSNPMMSRCIYATRSRKVTFQANLVTKR